MPVGRLDLFREKIGLSRDELAIISAHSEVFKRKKQEFAGHFFDFFYGIPETRRIIEQMERPESIRDTWVHWFETVFKGAMDDYFLAYLWGIGTRHAEVNLDQRFTNLGFSIVRQFCHRIIQEDVPFAERADVYRVVDKILDFFILVETSSFIDATSRCDIEIIKGLADRIRNPVTVIGGNLKRLKRGVSPAAPEHAILENLLFESGRCALMVKDIKTYIDLFHKESVPRRVNLQPLIEKVLGSLREREEYRDFRADLRLQPDALWAEADPEDVETIFSYTLENSIEAATQLPKNGAYIRVESAPYRPVKRAVMVTIFNTGTPPRPEDIEKLFSLFYSTKPGGSGFGLPIVKLALRKNLGRITIEPVPGEGARVAIVLPAA